MFCNPIKVFFPSLFSFGLKNSKQLNMHTGTILLLHPVVGSNYHSNEIRISPDPRGLTRRAQLLAENMEEI